MGLSLRPWRDAGRLPALCALTSVATLLVLADAPASASTVTFNATADARVEKSRPSTNFGKSKALIADSSPTTHAYARFSVTGLTESVTSAKLRVRVTDRTTGGPAAHSTSPNWSETGITYNNRPSASSSSLAAKAAVATGWVDYDVTRAVAGNGSFGFVLIPGSSDGMTFDARESGSTNAPKLVITTADPSTAPAPSTPPAPTTSTPPASTVTSDVALPIPPRDYTVPAGGVVVSNGQQLANALAGTTVRDIVLADGVYTTAGTTAARPYFAAATGHRLWAARRGGAVLQAGLMLGGNYGAQGAEVHGLHFDIADRTRTYGGAALYVWGVAGTGAKVFDSTFEGHYALDQGIELRQVQDTVVQRVVVKHVRRVGVYVSDCCDSNWFDNTAQIRTLTDIDVEGVREVTPGSTDGKSEFGIWVGNRVVNPVERLRAEHTWWSGLWTGSSSRDTVFRDITIATVDRPNGNAIYAEHRTVNNTFERFRLGPDLNHGFICEWNYGSGVGACEGNVFRDGSIASRNTGIFLDEGQVANTVSRVRFSNQACAAIVNFRGVSNVFTDNDFTAIAPGAKQVADYCY